MGNLTIFHGVQCLFISQNMREREGPIPNVVVKSSQSRGASKGIKYNR